jgi:putative pyruvate formate lyase activating enzyme
MFVPSYVKLYELGELKRRAQILEKMLESCNICPHNCGVNRLKGEIARCYSGYKPIVSAYVPHFGEEPLLVGVNGAGNIFFGNCNLRCVYCQNYQISQNWKVEIKNEVTIERLAEIMLELQDMGCHNIGLVSPTHFVPQIVKALCIAVENGLRLPLVYNTNAYDSVEVLKLLDGIIDIYLPDIKYSDDENAWRYSKIKNYVKYSRLAIKEMWRQVGSELVIEDGVLKRGLIIRHLILPNDIAGSEDSLRWIAEELGKDVTLSIMAQYYPTNKAFNYPLISRRIMFSEYIAVIELLDKFGFENGWIQEFEESPDFYRPDFSDREEPFKDRLKFRQTTG